VVRFGPADAQAAAQGVCRHRARRSHPRGTVVSAAPVGTRWQGPVVYTAVHRQPLLPEARGSRARERSCARSPPHARTRATGPCGPVGAMWPVHLAWGWAAGALQAVISGAAGPNNALEPTAPMGSLSHAGVGGWGRRLTASVRLRAAEVGGRRALGAPGSLHCGRQGCLPSSQRPGQGRVSLPSAVTEQAKAPLPNPRAHRGVSMVCHCLLCCMPCATGVQGAGHTDRRRLS
jgi:hypothetical protein